MEFGRAMGIDLTGFEEQIRDKLRELEVRDDLGFDPDIRGDFFVLRLLNFYYEAIIL